ncbi:MAG: Gldg family protein [Planctomycetaceae bacterium]|jgi:ABC-2 type transport system permease protein|nr:Gldg family protein [Planctomycetaceae bacterium]
MNTKVLRAVFRRNFVGYFANPTGYVFICVFVLLSSIAAFLPDEFFNINLANLDQLNLWFPLIMLVFVPAVTMGIWADEKRQGTDELLLTIPAADFDIVMGKFCAAIGILTVSLLFSFVSNLTVLSQLGHPDIGLFVSTYIGFWLIGLMMVAVGMAASFLTGNLTVAYILGALFNAPLVAIQWSYALPIGRSEVSFMQAFSIQSQFASFGRGIVSFSGIVYFVSIMGVMLYISMVLISKRHWSANQAFHGWAHYLTRGVALLIIAVCLSYIFQRFDLRYDLTEDRLSSLSKETFKLLQEINPKHPVTIEAFISDDVPQEYVETRLNTLAMLREIASRGAGRVFVNVHSLKPNTKEAVQAEQRFGIQPKTVISLSQGGIGKREPVFMGVVMRSGLNTVKLPFIEKGVSPEYELVRAVCSVTAQTKKKIGVLKTDAKVMGDFNFMTMTPPQPWSVIEELRRQYLVSEVDPAMPIQEKYDVLLAVQPSSLAPNDMTNFIDAVKAGQPTLIFEDPTPISDPSIPGTNDPKTAGGGGMAFMQQPLPKGIITPLWDFLGVNFDTKKVPKSAYNPFPRLGSLPQEVLFVAYDRKKDKTSDTIPFQIRDSITSKLQHLVLLFAGSIDSSETSKLKHTNLIWTTKADGYVLRSEMFPGGLGMRPDMNCPIYEDSNQYNLAVKIEGEVPPETPLTDTDGQPLSQEPVKVKVILVADIDMIAENFYQLRQQGASVNVGAFLDFDNITFLLNAIDSLAGEERFIPVRSRRVAHKTLTKFDEMTDEYRKAADEQQIEAQQNYNQMQEKIQKEIAAEIEKLSQQVQDDPRLTTQEVLAKIQAISTTKNKMREVRTAELKRTMEEKVMNADVNKNEKIRTIQGRVKTLAILVPPIPLLMIAVAVFVVRRMKETEGVAQSRLRNRADTPVRLPKKR